MARHIMAVCVVCLLCADRLPCQQHLDLGILPADPTAADGQQQNLEYQQLNAKVFQRFDMPRELPSTSSTDKHYSSSSSRSSSSNTNSNSLNDNQLYVNQEQNEHYYRRYKRHAGHAHDVVEQRPEITEHFLQRIFDEYGQSDGTIRMDDFQRMLKQLGLHQLVKQKLSKAENISDNCIGDTKLVRHVQPHDLSHRRHHHNNAANCSLLANGTDGWLPCEHKHFKDEANAHRSAYSNNYTLSQQDLVHLCPILLYQLSSPLEVKRSGCIDGSVLMNIDNYEATHFNKGKDDIMYVWIYSFASVFACGILGLVGVTIIPFMETPYYKHIIQFLVALAVGTMTGDALLHLLPHSLAGQTEQNMIFKGLVCMSGIIFFYITEHGLTMISEWRKRIAKSETMQPSRAKVVRDPDSSMNNSVTGDKVCKSKYSSYPYCYDEIAMDTKNDIHLPPPSAAKRKLHASHSIGGGELHDIAANNVERKRNGKAESDACEAGVGQSLLWNSQIGDGFNNHHQHHEHQHHHLADSNTISTDLDGNAMGDSLAVGGGTNMAAAAAAATINGSGKDNKLLNNETVTVILREHESSHHGHSHKHGHVHSPPESLSAVAWMIIMGDGLHNFTDGMAIGAAFAENIAGGFSTSLAVFCHELPHELGDFAILIKAGMSVKSAVYYNLLTGVLSFIGMIFGIIFGQSPDAAQWMFAAAAGLFIYIALVDMMPELSSAHKSVEQFGLQVLGMCSGVLIMLLIAIYEGDLMNVFSSSSGSTTGHHQHVH